MVDDLDKGEAINFMSSISRAFGRLDRGFRELWGCIGTYNTPKAPLFQGGGAGAEIFSNSF